MIEIRVVRAGHKLTVRVPEGVDDIEIIFPPGANNGEGGNGRKSAIILTDRH
jgi:hypothetical protein